MKKLRHWLYNFFVFYTVERVYHNPEWKECKIGIFKPGWVKVRRTNYENWYNQWQYRRWSKWFEKYKRESRKSFTRISPVIPPGHYVP
jgi:hypothetical protein